MSRAFNGGRETYTNEKVPQTKQEVLSILQRFVRERFKDAEIRNEIAEEGHHIIKLATDGNEESSMLFDAKGELIAHGSFVYPAKEHSVQIIWKNKFEVRKTGEGILVNVSDWYGPTVDSWEEDKRRAN